MTLLLTLNARLFKHVIYLFLYLLDYNYQNLKTMSVLYVFIKLFYNRISISIRLFYSEIFILMGFFYSKKYPYSQQITRFSINYLIKRVIFKRKCVFKTKQFFINFMFLSIKLSSSSLYLYSQGFLILKYLYS